jgi:hypothetical protein
VQKYWIGLLILLCVTATPRAFTQRNSSTVLVVRIGPEARVDPSQITLSFRVPDQLVQTATVTALVRALPNQQIHIAAHLLSLTGPGGPVPPTALAWNGTVSGATSGGQQAGCTSGAFASGSMPSLATNWRQSGMLRCTVSFALSGAALAAGSYSGMLSLAATAQ